MHPYLEEAVRASHLPYLLGCLTSLADSLPRTEAWEAGDSRLLLSPNYATCPGKGLPTEGLHTCGTRTQQAPHGYAWAWGPSASLRVPALATQGGDPPGRIWNLHSNGMTVLPKGRDSEARSREQLCGDRKVTHGNSTALGRPCHRARHGASTSPMALTTL